MPLTGIDMIAVYGTELSYLIQFMKLCTIMIVWPFKEDYFSTHRICLYCTCKISRPSIFFPITSVLMDLPLMCHNKLYTAATGLLICVFFFLFWVWQGFLLIVLISNSFKIIEVQLKKTWKICRFAVHCPSGHTVGLCTAIIYILFTKIHIYCGRVLYLATCNEWKSQNETSPGGPVRWLKNIWTDSPIHFYIGWRNLAQCTFLFCMCVLSTSALVHV